MASTTNPADASMVEAEETVPRRSVTVFRCLFPTGWEDSSQESNNEAADTSHADSQPTDESQHDAGDETTPEMPVPVPADDSTSPEIAQASPPAAPSDKSVAPERPPATAENCTTPSTPATPLDSSTFVPPTPITNSSPAVQSNVSPPSTVSQPPSASTVGSEAQDAGDVSSEEDTMEHDEYKELIVSKTQSRRIVRNSTRPTLWRHQRRPKASICLYDAIDDGVCLVQTGLLWSIDGQLFEIVYVSSLGWVQQKATRSHQVAFNNNPIYVVVRAASLQGREIEFDQLQKLVAATVFREGRACSVVSFRDIAKAQELATDFVNKHERDYTAWAAINYMRTNKELEEQRKQEQETARKLREQEENRARRIREKEEAVQKQKELRDLKRKEELAKRAAVAAAKKTARAESEKRRRQIQRVVTIAVASAVRKVEKNLEGDVIDRVEKLREELDTNLGNRIAQCEDAVENLLVTKACFEKFKTTMDGSFEKFKTTMDKRLKNLARKKKKAVQHNEENEDPAPPLKRSKSKAWTRTEENQPPMVRSNSLPPPTTSMPSNYVMRPAMSHPATLRMSSHSRPRHPSFWVHGHGHVDSPMQPLQDTTIMDPRNIVGTPRYMSPVFGQRNYAR